MDVAKIITINLLKGTGNWIKWTIWNFMDVFIWFSHENWITKEKEDRNNRISIRMAVCEVEKPPTERKDFGDEIYGLWN